MGTIRQRVRRTRGWRTLRRSALLWWTAAAVVGALTAAVVAQSLSRVEAESARWGRMQRVWVMHQPIEAGVALTRGDVGLESRPRGLVPAGALDAASSPLGRAARIELTAGQVLVATHLAGGAVRGPAAAIAPGRLGVGIPSGPGMPPVRVGDQVDVLATFDVGGSDLEGAAAQPDSTAPPSFSVAVDAEVLVVSPTTITVSVDALDAPRVAFAVARGAVTLALRGPHPPRAAPAPYARGDAPTSGGQRGR